ncbi:MAG: hypothetical protein HOE53_03255 [Candidatus Magasanikbacteria bacterium]|jgi:hypothetical protein|nr:hypothetical protein [Candidatus Magasanikbacteria bacterium]
MKLSRLLLGIGGMASLLLLASPALAGPGLCATDVYYDHAYKSADSSAVYYITEDCTKRVFKNASTFFTYFDSWSEVETVSKAALDGVATDALGFMPAGPQYDPQYGALVKSVKDPKVYFLLGGKKYWVRSEYDFNRLGYKWGWVEDVDQRLIDKYPLGTELNYWEGHPNYTILKHANDPKVYRLEPHPEDASKTVKRHIKNERVFKDLGFRMDRIVEINECDWSDYDCVRIKDSLSSVSEGDVINRASDARTPAQEVTLVPQTSSIDGFTQYEEPVYDFEYILPDNWLDPTDYTYGSGDSEVFSLTSYTSDYRAKFTAGVTKNQLTLDPELRRELLLLTFDVDYGSMTEAEIEKHFKKIEKRLLEIYEVDTLEDMEEEDAEAISNVLMSVGLFQIFLGSGEREVTFDTFAGYRDIFHLSMTTDATEYSKAKQHDMYIMFMGSKLYSFSTSYDTDASEDVKDDIATILKNIEIIK